MTSIFTLNTSLTSFGTSNASGVLALPSLVLGRVQAALKSAQMEISRAIKVVSREYCVISASVFKAGKTALADPKAALTKVDIAFVALKEKLETPIEVINCGLEWAALIEHLEHFAASATHIVEKATAPLALVPLIAKMKKVHQRFFGAQVEGVKAPKALEVVSASLSIFSSLCTAISDLQKNGMLSHAGAISEKMDGLIASCHLAIELIDLVDAIRDHKDNTTILKAVSSSLTKMSSWLQKTGLLTQVAAISVKTNGFAAFCDLTIAMVRLVKATSDHKDRVQILKEVFSVVTAMSKIVLLASTVYNPVLLLLLLKTGTLILNIMYPEKAYEEGHTTATAI
ncbi:MAG TPA: hypothetical protein VHK67_00470 [Rhabdochlamydiaceae bacterium]|jgi:hypothetical protein|nr:hypothetical protein [Rhabdochlamydiaceae bacterium]